MPDAHTTLVTGANGHIGSHIVKYLIGRGRSVRAFVRSTSDLRSIDGLDVELVYGDVLDRASVQSAVQGCRVVYHTAAVYALWSPDDRVILRTAIDGSENVISACARCGVHRVVYTSSAASVGISDKPRQLRSEHDFNKELDVPAYVTAKTDSENLAAACARESGLNMVIVNPTLVLGPGDHRPTPSNTLVKQFVESGSPLFYDGGANVVDVEDVALGHILAEEKGRNGERYILGGDNITVRDMLNFLAELTGRTRPKFRIGRAPAMAAGLLLQLLARFTGKTPLLSFKIAKTYVGRYGYFDTSKAEMELGYTYRPHPEVLMRAVDWFKNQLTVGNTEESG